MEMNQKLLPKNKEDKKRKAKTIKFPDVNPPDAFIIQKKAELKKLEGKLKQISFFKV